MLVEQIDQLSERIKRRAETNKYNERVQQLKNIAETVQQLERTCEAIDPFVRTTFALLSTNTRLALHLRFVELHGQLNRLSQAFVNGERNLPKYIVANIDELLNQTKTDLATAWSETIKLELSGSNTLATLISPLLPASRATAILRAYQLAAQYKDNLPSGEQGLNTYYAARDAFIQLVDTEMPTFPPAIQSFLRLVNAQAATLKDVTSDVIEWGHKHNLLEKFSVLIK